jgi:hypothetical protein
LLALLAAGWFRITTQSVCGSESVLSWLRYCETTLVLTVKADPLESLRHSILSAKVIDEPVKIFPVTKSDELKRINLKPLLWRNNRNEMARMG